MICILSTVIKEATPHYVGRALCLLNDHEYSTDFLEADYEDQVDIIRQLSQTARKSQIDTDMIRSRIRCSRCKKYLIE